MSRETRKKTIKTVFNYGLAPGEVSVHKLVPRDAYLLSGAEKGDESAFKSIVETLLLGETATLFGPPTPPCPERLAVNWIDYLYQNQKYELVKKLTHALLFVDGAESIDTHIKEKVFTKSFNSTVYRDSLKKICHAAIHYRDVETLKLFFNPKLTPPQVMVNGKQDMTTISLIRNDIFLLFNSRADDINYGEFRTRTMDWLGSSNKNYPQTLGVLNAKRSILQLFESFETLEGEDCLRDLKPKMNYFSKEVWLWGRKDEKILSTIEGVMVKNKAMGDRISWLEIFRELLQSDAKNKADVLRSMTELSHKHNAVDFTLKKWITTSCEAEIFDAFKSSLDSSIAKKSKEDAESMLKVIGILFDKVVDSEHSTLIWDHFYRSVYDMNRYVKVGSVTHTKNALIANTLYQKIKGIVEMPEDLIIRRQSSYVEADNCKTHFLSLMADYEKIALNNVGLAIGIDSSVKKVKNRAL